ncbi:MAG: MarR family transcriptional regulator [Pseudomonadota bacterium]
MSIRKNDWMQAWVSLIHAGTFLRQGLERELRTTLGLSLAEQDLIKQLYLNDRRLTLSELSDRIYFSKAGVTRMLDRLEDAGFVKREATENDRRALHAVLTRKGENAFASSREVLERYVKKHLRDALGDDDLLALKDSLESLLRSHGVWDGQKRHLRGGRGA